jgi:transposase-like protein
VVGRGSGRIRLLVCDDTVQDTIAPKVRALTSAEVTLYTDEQSAYAPAASGEDNQRARRAVCHSDGGPRWRRDSRSSLQARREGIWTGLRGFLRTFRGVHEKYSAQSRVAMFELTHTLEQVTNEHLWLLMLPGYNPLSSMSHMLFWTCLTRQPASPALFFYPHPVLLPQFGHW